MNAVLPAIERILQTLWVGSLWAVGFLVAPVLFAVLDDRALAGSIAGNLFTMTSYVGLCCGAMLLMISAWRTRACNWRIVVIAVMLLLVAAGQFVLTPMIADLRVQGLTDTPRFGQLHGAASALFLFTSVLGLALVAARQPEA